MKTKIKWLRGKLTNEPELKHLQHECSNSRRQSGGSSSSEGMLRVAGAGGKMSLPGELLWIKAAATNTCSSHGEATARLSFHGGCCQLHLCGVLGAASTAPRGHLPSGTELLDLHLICPGSSGGSEPCKVPRERGYVSKEVRGKGPLVSLCPPWG